MTVSRRDFLCGHGSRNPEPPHNAGGLSKRQLLSFFAVLLFVLFGIRVQALEDELVRAPRDGRLYSPEAADAYMRLLKRWYA